LVIEAIYTIAFRQEWPAKGSAKIIKELKLQKEKIQLILKQLQQRGIV
jgi:hypothetical protein